MHTQHLSQLATALADRTFSAVELTQHFLGRISASRDALNAVITECPDEALAAVRDVQPAEVRTATSFSREGGYQPDYCALTMNAEVVFPWDRKIFDGDDFVVNPRYEGFLDE